MIPKIIHQIWLGKEKKPPLTCIQTWVDKHPDWTHILWNEERIKKEFPHGLFNQWVFDQNCEQYGKADVLRYEILYYFGGVYIDADSICLNKLDDFFLENRAFACFENEKARGGLISNGYLGSEKRNRLMEILIKKIQDRPVCSQPHIMPWMSIGPIFLTEMIDRYDQWHNIKVYPSHYFLPEHYSGINYTGTDKIYSRQFWSSSPRALRKYSQLG